MIRAEGISINYYFKLPSQAHEVKSGLGIKDKPKEDISNKKEYLLCARCGEAITRESDRITVEGSHCHTFANPHGIVFEIGCFKSVTGCCGFTGNFSDEFSWFKGFSWKVTFCRICLAHLGWMFFSNSLGVFYGLILGRLISGRDG